MKYTNLLILLFSLTAHSSTEVERTYGIFTGMSLAQMAYSVDQESSFKRGLILGVDYEFPLSEHIYLQPNLYVVQKGDENPTGSIRLSYFEVSLTPKFKTSTDSTGFYFMIGPYVASILSRTSANTVGLETPLYDDSVKNTEAGMLAGLGYEFLASHHWTIYVEGRYAMGITSSLEKVDAYNRAFYFNIGFHYLDREDLVTNFDRAEEFVKKKNDSPSAPKGEQSIRPGKQDPFANPSPH